MSDALDQIKVELFRSNNTCIVRKGEQTYTSDKRGVRPLLDWLDIGMDFSGYVAADRVVGNGAAFLYVLLNVKELYAHVLSRPAAETLERYHIRVAYGTLVDNIRNREGNGICPIEEAVTGETVAADALRRIRARLAELAPKDAKGTDD